MTAGSGSGLPEAVVFDFDGTMVDSETPIFEASAAALAQMGLDLTVAGWATCVGLGHEDSHRALCAAVGATFDRADFEARYEAQDRSWVDRLPPLPGVVPLIDALTEAGVPLGVASSSSSAWVEGHLRRLGLADRFGVIATRDLVDGRTKPDPASYRHAVEALGADAARSVAIEDSGPGIAAALGAGMAVVAVPSPITAHTDLSAAPHTVAGLAELTPAALGALLAPPGRRRP